MQLIDWLPPHTHLNFIFRDLFCLFAFKSVCWSISLYLFIKQNIKKFGCEVISNNICINNYFCSGALVFEEKWDHFQHMFIICMLTQGWGVPLLLLLTYDMENQTVRFIVWMDHFVYCFICLCLIYLVGLVSCFLSRFGMVFDDVFLCSLHY